MTRVLFVTDVLTRGGGEKKIALLASHLPRYGYDTHVLVFDDKGYWAAQLREEGVPVTAHGFSLRGQPLWRIAPPQTLKLARAIRRCAPDVVVADKYDTSIWATFAAKLAGVRCILNYRQGMAYPRPADLPPRRRWKNRAADVSFRFVDRFVAVSHQVAQSMMRIEAINAADIGVIHSSVAIPETIDDAHGKAFRQQYGIRQETLVIGLLANFHPIKRHTLLLEAARSLVGQHDITVVMAGGTLNDEQYAAQRAAVEAAIAEYGLAEHVVLTGSLDDVSGFLTAIDIGVLCSDSEGFPLSAIEIGAYSTPLVASRVGGVPEIVNDGETGLLFPAGDAEALARHLRTLIMHPQQRARMGQAARDRMATFSLENELSAWDTLLQSGC